LVRDASSSLSIKFISYEDDTALHSWASSARH
jgi:hypothetical protein